MLGLDRDAAELAGLITGEEENPSRPFCIAFEHPACLRFRVARRASLPSIIRHSLRSGRCLIPAQPPSYDAVCDHKGVSVDVPATIAMNYGVMGDAGSVARDFSRARRSPADERSVVRGAGSAMQTGSIASRTRHPD